MRERWMWLLAAGLALVLVAHAAGLAAGGMAKVVAWLFLIQLVPLLAVPVGLFAAGVAAYRRSVGAATAATLVLSAVGAAPGLVGFGVYPVRFPATIEGTTPSATVRLPTDTEIIVGWGGDEISTNYHAFDPAQRWAYDLLVAPSGHGAPELADYGCYGVPVVAPAGGMVAHVEDGHPDQRPAEYTTNFEHPAGNVVAIRMEDTGTYLVVAHLQRGSVAVAKGDTVREGQLLGRCGSSGNSSEPHVHLHHQRHDPADMGLLSEGLPLFFRDHRGPPMPVGGFTVAGDRVTFTGDVVQHVGR